MGIRVQVSANIKYMTPNLHSINSILAALISHIKATTTNYYGKDYIYHTVIGVE